jgi:four helix bundle protein
MAKTIEELPIFQRAREFCVAVTALLDRPGFHRNRDLRDQISKAADSITANMREGFEQPTDDAFNKYLFISKGSLGEVLARLATACGKRIITAEELESHTATGEALGKMLGGFIKYLARSDFKDRGRHKIKDSRIKDSGSRIQDQGFRMKDE